MKKRENMRQLPYFCATTGARPSALGVPPSLGRFPRLQPRDTTGAPGPIFITPSTIRDRRGETRVDDPFAAVPFAELDRPGLGLALGVTT